MVRPGQKPKRQCPYCGAMKVGLEDHIRDKHGKNPGPPPVLPRGPVRPQNVSTSLVCPDCGARPMVLRAGHHGPYYACPEWPRCRGAHGAHPDGTPKGTPADAYTRKLRQAAHASIDPLWRPGPQKVFPTRMHVYLWMQNVMGMTAEEAHIGSFDAEQCIALVNHVHDCFEDDIDDILDDTPGVDVDELIDAL